MKRILTFAIALTALLSACCRNDGTQLDYGKLNARAWEEYQTPVHPYVPGESPCWNTYSRDFKFAPVFDFKPADGAVKYRYTVWQDTATSYYWTVPMMQRQDNKYPKNPSSDTTCGYFLGIDTAAPTAVSWTFEAATPNESLAEIWQDIPVGNSRLIVEALDASGNPVSVVGDRLFIRDFPFEGPYPTAPRPYREAALKAAFYVHNLPAIQAWKDNCEPDMSYKHNTYACKIIGSTIRLETYIARNCPNRADECIAIARNAAAFLMAESQPEGTPCAFFPPTYYKGEIASAKAENQGTTMMMEAATAGNGLLDLYDLTGDKVYYDHARGIADTYVRLQREDGSYPVKIYLATGEPSAESAAMTGPLLNYFLRFHNQYGVKDYDGAMDKCEKWLVAFIQSKFDLKGQFEDGTQNGWKEYQNMTNSAGSSLVSYLCAKQSMTDEQMALAEELMHFNEDQFVHWNSLPNRDGYRQIMTPGVYEQYEYRVPIDASAHNVGTAWLGLYARNSDELMFAKAKALADAVVIVQDPISGQIPTTWDLRPYQKHLNRAWWINCTYCAITLLERMAELTGE